MTGPVVRRKDLILTLRLVRGSGLPLYRQVESQLLEEISRGRLLPGTALPGSRELASQLGVNRKTVALAYDELVSQGWLTSNPMKGTFVSDRGTGRPCKNASTTSPSSTKQHYSIYDSDVTVPVFVSGGPIGSFDDGLPDPRILPINEFGRAYRSCLLAEARAMRLGYSDPRGSEALRASIARMLNSERGLSVGVDNICITRGSQMAIYLATRILARPGDTVALEELTYPPAHQSFRSHGVNVVPVRVGLDGVDLEHLEQLCRRQRIRSLYLTPHHHFPTTVTLPPEKRLRLLSIAEQYRFSIIEDDYDHEFNFGGQPMLPMAGFSPAKVVYIGSFSKTLSPHLRLGYIVANPATINAIANQIVLLDRQGDQVSELAVAKLLEQGDVVRHIRKALGVYQRRRDEFAVLLRNTFGDRISFSLPHGGLAFWVELSEADLQSVLAASIGGIRLLTSHHLQIGEQSRRGLRLGYASKTTEEAESSLITLKRRLK